MDLGTGVFPDAPRVAAEQAQAVVTVASVRAGDRYWRPLDGYIHATDGRVTGWSSFGLPFQRADVAPDLDRTFQAHELDRLVGPYPEAAATYRARSPLHAVDRIARPVLLVHGLEDTVVLPSQAQVMAEALARRGIRHVLLTFPGEGHGFRRPGSIRRALEVELSFYLETLGLTHGKPDAPLATDDAIATGSSDQRQGR